MAPFEDKRLAANVKEEGKRKNYEHQGLEKTED